MQLQALQMLNPLGNPQLGYNSNLMYQSMQHSGPVSSPINQQMNGIQMHPFMNHSLNGFNNQNYNQNLVSPMSYTGGVSNDSMRGNSNRSSLNNSAN
jgi:hypothetical protein